jgi:hypothetical protein
MHQLDILSEVEGKLYTLIDAMPNAQLPVSLSLAIVKAKADQWFSSEDNCLA